MSELNRRKTLMRLLDRHHSATVDQLCEWLSASAATVRRDIAWLSEHNMIARVRGGAQRLAVGCKQEAASPVHFQSDLGKAAAAKRAIARHAASLCQEQEVVIINGGTTTYMMAEFLTEKRLTVLTNSFLMAERLLISSDNEVVLPGGQVYREQNLILSHCDNDITGHYYARKMFMGGYGIARAGLMEADPVLLKAVRRLLGQAEQLVVLADSSKFHKRASAVICRLEHIHRVITDAGIDDASVQMLEHAGVTVDVVAPDYAN